MWVTLFILACTIYYSNGETAECLLSSANYPQPCQEDITNWANINGDGADYDPPEYDCSAGPTYSVEEAAMIGDDCVPPECSRVRRNLYSLTPEQMHVVLKAMYCSHWRARNVGDGMPLMTKAEYMENQWGYVSTYHGAPGWFAPCNDFDDPEIYAKGIGPPGCCAHTNPNFVLFHRLLMMQYENSLRRWNLTFALPYWDWTNDPNVSITRQLPPLLRDQTWDDEYAGITISNPYYNFNTTDSPINQYIAKNYNSTTAFPQYSCDFVCKAEAYSLYYRADPEYTGGQTWLDQVLQSFRTEYFITFDLNYEVPHNNIHNLIGGNMPDLWYDGPDPIFTFHHSQVERLFLIWQQLMEYRGIDYRENSTWSKYIGNCFAGSNGFYLRNSPVRPFYNDPAYGTYNNDPMTMDLSTSAFECMKYNLMGYSYDDMTVGGMDIAELNEYLFENKYRVILAWNLRYLDIGYKVHYYVYEFGAANYTMDKRLAHGTFSTLTGVTDSWSVNNFPRHLYKEDITRQLIANGVTEDEFATLLLDVVYYIEPTSTAIEEYLIDDINVYHPFIIKETTNGSETIQVFFGDDERYQYNNLSIFLHDDLDVTTITEDSTVEFIFVDDVEIFIDYHFRYDPNVVFRTQNVTVNDTVANDYGIYGKVTFSHTDYTNPEELFSSNYYIHTLGFYTDESNAELIQNKIYNHGKNVIRNGDDSVYIEVYPSVAAFSKVDTYQIFNDPEQPNAMFVLNEHLFMPWDTTFINSTLYDKIYEYETLQTINFFSCSNKGSSLPLCQVDESGYDNCDATDAIQCGVDIYGNITTDEDAYYFIDNTGKCTSGMKVGVKVTGAISGGCTWCDLDATITTGDVTVSIDGADYFFSQTIDHETCQASMSFDMPLSYDWVAYGLFGQWQNPNSVDKMLGMAAVGVVDWEKNPAWFSLCGPGCHGMTSLMECGSITHDEVNSKRTYTDCTFQFCTESLANWIVDGEQVTQIEVGTDYPFMWAGYQPAAGAAPLGGFTAKHSNGGHGTVSYSYQVEIETTGSGESPDSCNVLYVYNLFAFVLYVAFFSV